MGSADAVFRVCCTGEYGHDGRSPRRWRDGQRSNTDGEPAARAGGMHGNGCGFHSPQNANPARRATDRCERRARGRSPPGLHEYSPALRPPGSRSGRAIGAKGCDALGRQILLGCRHAEADGEDHLRHRRVGGKERSRFMRTIGIVVGLLLIVFGVVWILQGINVLPGSFMSGRPGYAVLGLAVTIVGLVILLRSARRRPAMVGPRT